MRLNRRALIGAAGGCLLERAWAQTGGVLYLTIDTGWMQQAEQIAALLSARRIRATLFVANEPTYRGNYTLDDGWSSFWKARADEGQRFASHTWRHWYFQRDLGNGQVRYAARGGTPAQNLRADTLAEELRRPVERIRALTGAVHLPLWRAPGGRLTANAVRLAEDAGFYHVGWNDAGFLGDELDSERYPNSMLLDRALARLQNGNIMMMHWGIRDRRDPFVNVLGPLLDGLMARGFRFSTLAEHPVWGRKS